MSIIDKILEKVNLKFNDLTSVERETLNSMAETLTKNQLTIENVREFINSMRDGVEKELTGTDHNNKQDIFLKARLRNLMLLSSFLDKPKKAEEAIDRALAGMVKSK